MPTIPEIISKIRRRFGATDSHRTSPHHDESDDDMEEIDDIEAPKAGATIEDPPDGGIRAWLIVVSCSVINVIIGTIEPMVGFALLLSKDETKLDDDDAEEIYLVFLSIASVYAPIASVSMATIGYELTIHAGSWCTAFSFLILSFIKDIHGIKFLIYVIAGVGSSLIQLGVLIPVLEYFTTKRMRALMFTKISRYIGRFIPIIIYVASDDFSTWKTLYRICFGLSFVIGLVGLTIPSLKLKMKTDGRTSFIARTLGMGQMKIVKDAFLWLVCFLFFVYQIAVEPPNAEFTNTTEMPKRLKIDESISKLIVYNFSAIIGLIAGAFLGWLFKFAANRKFFGYMKEVPTTEELFNIILITMISAPCLIAIMCFIAPEATNLPYFFLFRVLFSAQLVFIEELRDESIPDVFGRQNVKFVEGLVQMCVGIGGIIGSESSASLKWKNSFRMGGGMCVVTTAVASLMLFQRLETGASILKINKLKAAFSGGTQGTQDSSERLGDTARSRQPSRIARDKTQAVTPNTNIKFRYEMPYGPSKTKFVLPNEFKSKNGQETLTGTRRNSTSSSNDNPQVNETQNISTGRTVFTNIQNSLSPTSYSLAQQNQLSNINYSIQGGINPASEHIMYSYNIMQNTDREY